MPRSQALSRWLALGCWALYVLTAGPSPRTVDEWSAYWLSESLVAGEGATAPQGPRMGMAYGRYGRGGHFYPPTELLPSVLMAPAMAAGFVLRVVFAGNEHVHWFGPGVLCAMVTALVSAAGVGLFHQILLRLGYSGGVALTVAVVYGAATIAWPYGGFLFREPYLAIALLGTWYSLLDGRIPPRRRALLGGLWLAAGFLCKREAIFSLPAMTWLVWRMAKGDGGDRLRETAGLLAGPAIAVAFQLGLNLWRFGDPLQFGYPLHDETGAALVAFSTPLWRGLYGFLLSPGKSIVLFSPPVLLGMVGLLVAWKGGNRTLIAFCGLLAGSNLLIYSNWNHWEGGWCWGPRHALPWTPFLLVGIAELLRLWPGSRRIRLALGVAVVWGAGVQVLGTFVDYYAYESASGLYMANLNEYQMSFSPWRGHVSFLWLMIQRHLSGQWAEFDLWPLFFWRSLPSSVERMALLGGWLLVCLTGFIAWAKVLSTLRQTATD